MKFADFYQMERMANFPTKGSLDSLGLVSGSRLLPVLYHLSTVIYCRIYHDLGNTLEVFQTS